MALPQNQAFWTWFQANYSTTEVESDFISIRDTWKSFKESKAYKELKSKDKRQCTYTNMAKPILHGFGGPERCYSELKVGNRIHKDVLIKVKENRWSEARVESRRVHVDYMASLDEGWRVYYDAGHDSD